MGFPSHFQQPPTDLHFVRLATELENASPFLCRWSPANNWEILAAEITT